jgi:hypothetical protein
MPMKRMTLLLMLVLPTVASGQDTDEYYAPEAERVVISADEVKRLYRWGPKLGIELHAAIDYNHLQVPMSIAGGFEKATGGVGMDAGGGLRVRLYHKLAMAAGFNFAIRNYALGYEAMDVDTVNPQTYKVEENVTMYLMGFYQKTIIELSRKIHLAQTFQYTWLHRYKGRVNVENLTTPSSIIAPFDTDEPLLYGWSAPSGQAELGLELAYKLHIANELIIKPYFGLGYVFTPAVHTGILMQTPSLFGAASEVEQNPSFINLRLGVIFETGLWTDRPKRN